MQGNEGAANFICMTSQLRLGLNNAWKCTAECIAAKESRECPSPLMLVMEIHCVTEPNRNQSLI